MTQAHTPGPWRVDADGYIRSYEMTNRVNGNPMNVGTVCYGFKPEDQMVADARLIAAAPDLLAALRVVWNSIDRVNHPAAEVVRAAIAKAEGV